MIEIFQIVRVKETFSYSKGFDVERIERCFKAFNEDMALCRIKSEDTSWLFMSEKSASAYCERHNTTLEKALAAVGLNEVSFEFNFVIPNTVMD